MKYLNDNKCIYFEDLPWREDEVNVLKNRFQPFLEKQVYPSREIIKFKKKTQSNRSIPQVIYSISKPQHMHTKLNKPKIPNKWVIFILMKIISCMALCLLIGLYYVTFFTKILC